MNAESNKGSGHFKAAYSIKTQEETRQFYGSWAKTYDKEVGDDNAYAQPARATEMLIRFLQDKQTKILDAGCGSGLSGIALNGAGYSNVDGCDFSPEMLKIAKAKGCYKNTFEADLNKGQPDITNESYAAITCVGVFSFGHVHPDACDDLLRILKTGGFLIIALNEQFWDKGDLPRKIDDMVSKEQVRVRAKEYGDHLPGQDVRGWVIALEKL